MKTFVTWSVVIRHHEGPACDCSERCTHSYEELRLKFIASINSPEGLMVGDQFDFNYSSHYLMLSNSLIKDDMGRRDLDHILDGDTLYDWQTVACRSWRPAPGRSGCFNLLLHLEEGNTKTTYSSEDLKKLEQIVREWVGSFSGIKFSEDENGDW